MKRKIICLVVLGFVFGFQGIGVAASSITQTVTFEVTAINEISVSGNPAKLTVNSATAGSGPTDATDATTTYAITTNQSTRKITGQITNGGAMPANTTLKINLAAPTGGSSQGDVTLLAASAADLVTGISTLAESAKTITYKFSATIAAGVVAEGQRTVTLTVTAGS